MTDYYQILYHAAKLAPTFKAYKQSMVQKVFLRLNLLSMTGIWGCNLNESSDSKAAIRWKICPAKATAEIYLMKSTNSNINK